MSPDVQSGGKNSAASNGIYTGVLLLAFCGVLITALVVAIKCLSQYGTIFKMP